MNRVSLEDAGVTFKLRELGRLTLKDWFVRRAQIDQHNPAVEVRALENINLDLVEGDRLGIIGHNGAGKSTLLRLLAGVYPPTSGRREVSGKIVSLFDLALGFEMEATGRENIALRGYLQGETPTSIRDKIGPISDFSGLGRFLEIPMRFYSAGMKVRLAFAISTAIDPEILLIDEVLAAGDLEFQDRAFARMRELIDRAKLLVLASHDLSSVERLCNRAIWMDRGRVRYAGGPAETVSAYRDHYKEPTAVRAA